MLKYFFCAQGHENITATHKSTLEITKDSSLTKRGTCIVAVSATKSLPELPQSLKKQMKNNRAKIKLILKVDDLIECIEGYGHESLILTHPTDMVCRKSNYVCPRTLMINANKAAKDLNRAFVEKIKNRNAKIFVTIAVVTSSDSDI